MPPIFPDATPPAALPMTTAATPAAAPTNGIGIAI